MSNDFALFHVVSRKKNLVFQCAIFCHALFYFWTVIVQLEIAEAGSKKYDHAVLYRISYLISYIKQWNVIFNFGCIFKFINF